MAFDKWAIAAVTARRSLARRLGHGPRTRGLRLCAKRSAPESTPSRHLLNTSR